MNFSDRLLLDQGEIIFLHDKGKLDNGKNFYLYLAVKGTNLENYFQLLNAATTPSLVDLEKIGVVLAFGEGKPSIELKQRLSEQYGVYHP